MYNSTIEEPETNLHFKPANYPVKQKARTISFHLQEQVGTELEKLMKTLHFEKVKQVDEDCL